MKLKTLLIGCFGGFIMLNSCTESPSVKDYSAYVNPFIGTGGHGHTFPGAVVPHGMIQPSPDTRIDGWDACFRFDEWMRIFEDLGISPDFYATRHRDFDEVFPWDHLDYGIRKEFLMEECRRAC